MSYSDRKKSPATSTCKTYRDYRDEVAADDGFLYKGHYHNTTQHEVGNARYNLQCPFEY